MGACILCGKSAGFFYSLHKECFEKYEASDEPILEILENQLGTVTPQNITDNIQQQMLSYNFSSEASQRTLIRALEKFSSNHLEVLSEQNYQGWMDVLKLLALDESLFINSNFIRQQMNVPAIRNLRAGKLPPSNANGANFTVQLRQDEVIWWCFSSSHVEAMRPRQDQKKWSVLMQVVDNMLPAKNKTILEAEPLGSGKIWLTSQCFYYESESGVNSFEYNSIYACTPVKDGVRLQLKELNSRPQTFTCEDGRLLFEFIHFALKP